ncbi:hypothetical protein ELG88_18065 [Rhizobium leguminosarum]|uniref:hypothetical protein n=1 Tax=Rhizobium leguminosarum TaxID=384 RepID=UPI00102F7E07|nr:hypothetical protein [Rhizobium leguminosarum]TBF36989.1 hypothetical protein ELG88_18065 [Rhizobium leguminosarum]
MQSDANQVPHIVIFAILVVIAAGTILGFGERRKIVVFENYDDLFMTFSVPVLIYLSFVFLSMSKEGLLALLLGCTTLFASGFVFLFTVWRTLNANDYSVWRTALSIVTKFPLAFIWVLKIISLISPAGDTGVERAKNRASALLILTFLTPIIAALVVEKTGYFSPRQILKGKRIGGVRDHL